VAGGMTAVMGCGSLPQEIESRVSIVVVSYNHRDCLGSCLSSILGQCYRNYEVLVVDNASQDGSAEYVEEEFPGVRVIRNEENLGFSHANNKGAACAIGEYLAFLNPDTKVERNWLRELVAVLESSSQIGLVTPKILIWQDPERINTCGNDVHLTGLTLCRGYGEPAGAFAEPEEVDAISGAAFVIPRQLFEDLGGFDESFFMYVEDTDLSWRARLAGYRCFYAASSVIYHDYALHFGPRKVFYQERNRYLMLLKTLRWRTLLILAPALLLAEVVTWGYVLWGDRQHLGNKLRACRWIASNWSQIMQTRKHVQALRRVSDRELLSRCGYRLDYGQTAADPIARLAHFVFDPLFFVLRRMLLFLIW